MRKSPTRLTRSLERGDFICNRLPHRLCALGQRSRRRMEFFHAIQPLTFVSINFGEVLNVAVRQRLCSTSDVERLEVRRPANSEISSQDLRGWVGGEMSRSNAASTLQLPLTRPFSADNRISCNHPVNSQGAISVAVAVASSSWTARLGNRQRGESSCIASTRHRPNKRRGNITKI